MIMSVSNFPLGLAKGSSFCNRVKERGRLKANIIAVQPTLIMSPRRYGKTSLALKALHETKLPYAHIDLFSEADERDFEYSLLNGIAKLIAQLAGKPRAALTLAYDFFADLHIKVNIEKLGFSIQVDPKRGKPVHTILRSLEKLEKLAKKKKTVVILFVDEFQKIGDISSSSTLEGALRHVAQQSKNIMFLFSGSNRHLLQKIFDDSARPFYNLCDQIILRRISERDYLHYIQKLSIKKWGNTLEKPVVLALLACTHRHSYYVNLLCSRTWLCEKMPTIRVVENIWTAYVKEQKSRVAAEIDLLSANQRRLLLILAKRGGEKELMSASFSNSSGLSVASIRQAIKVLLNKDYVYQDDNGFYYVLDPLFEAALAS
jgi:uncharacterized protein